MLNGALALSSMTNHSLMEGDLTLGDFKTMFKELSEKLVHTYERGCLMFLTDLEHYTFVSSSGVDFFKPGDPFVQGGQVHRTIRDRKHYADTVERNIYGTRLKAWTYPIVENDEVIGAYGVAIPKLHPVAQGFPYFAEHLTNAFPGGAFLAITSLDKIVMRQGSQHFDLPILQIDTPLMESGVSKVAMRHNKVNVQEVDASVYGIALQGIAIPLYDPDDKDLVGSFTLFTARTIAEELQGLAANINASTEEIASVMEEVAASAGEISTNEGHLVERIREVADASTKISEIIEFIKIVADQTNMLGLNAAIEAARAGEYGRGFGVVADEIRKLSDQSKETAEQIRKLLMATDDNIKEVQQASTGTLKQSQEQAAATQEVTASVMEMANIAERLAETAGRL